MMPGLPMEPTSVQCTSHRVIEFEGHRYMAIWYPQMGGYGSHCLIDLDADGDLSQPDRCFDAIIWHDGEFPIGGSESPSVLHHCRAQQFIDFGTTVLQALNSTIRGPNENQVQNHQ